MAEHPLCHRRVSQSFFPAMCFFFVKKEKENFGPRMKERKKERKKEHKAVKKNADGHVVTNRIYNT